VTWRGPRFSRGSFFGAFQLIRIVDFDGQTAVQRKRCKCLCRAQGSCIGLVRQAAEVQKRTPAVQHPQAANDPNLPACLVGIGDCGGALYWARRLVQLGHGANLAAPQVVKPF
jgi:hypothetical protein